MSNLAIAYLFLIFTGTLGGHRFFLGKWFTGLIYFFTGGLCGLGVIYDIFALPFIAKETCTCQ